MGAKNAAGVREARTFCVPSKTITLVFCIEKQAKKRHITGHIVLICGLRAKIGIFQTFDVFWAVFDECFSIPCET